MVLGRAAAHRLAELLAGHRRPVRGAPASIATFLDASNLKYGTEIGIDFLDPDVTPRSGVPPRVVIALREADFTGSPTRWTFS